MQVTVKGKNVEVPPGLRAKVERKLGKVGRLDDRILTMDVEFSEERNPRVADAHLVEVTLHTRRQLIRAHAAGPDPAVALDRVVDRLKRQVSELKDRRLSRAHQPEPPPPAIRADRGPSGDDASPPG